MSSHPASDKPPDKPSHLAHDATVGDLLTGWQPGEVRHWNVAEFGPREERQITSAELHCLSLDYEPGPYGGIPHAAGVSDEH
jgi:hypothetical protein